MKKESSIGWYAKQLARIGLTDEVIGHLTKEAIELHKQEIIEAHESGVGSVEYGYGVEYYEETFKSE